jgi:DNA-binding SARP family transcriptional activator/tetratricopeptide (TPR) repeat protein
MVPTSALVTIVWDDDPPETARSQVHNGVWLLRRSLDRHGAAHLVHTEPAGYRLRADADRVDLTRFRRATSEGRRLAALGDLPGAAQELREAVSLWRGPALAGVTASVLEREAATLEQMRLAALEDCLDCELAVGGGSDAVAELTALVAEHPLRERFAAMLMVGLYRSGRQAEALDVYRRAASALADELGVDPGRELRRCHEAILRGDPSLDDPAATADAQPPIELKPAPHDAMPMPRFTLPADTVAFTGRTTELDALAAAAQGARVVAINAIDGMPGIGKTTLAVHAAHRFSDRFPDRQVFVDLHAHSLDRPPTAPADALADLLIADGVDPRQLPDSLDGRAGMWRARLAGTRTLIVLDNAASTAQISPLLPGAPGCLVLVTSRRRLADLTATHVFLDILPADDAIAMFLRLAPRARGQADAVAQVVEVCGYLPLAIAITASLYSRHTSWTIPQLIAEIRRRRLTATGEHHTVKAAFDLSHQHLPEPRQRFFRLLGLHPGGDIDGYAAAALADVPYERALGELEELYNDHLLDEPAYCRFRMHDLIRDYTHTQTISHDPPEVREQAVERLLRYYQHTAARADAYLSRHTRPAAASVSAPAAAPDIDGWDQAVAWLRTERPNLLACIRHASTHQLHHHTIGLTAGIATLLRTDGPWSLAADLHRTAADTARQSGDQHHHANALHDQCIVRQLTGDYPGAADVLGQVLNLYQVIGDRRGHANALHELGVLRYLTGDFLGAADLLRQALSLHQVIDDRRGHANTLHELGVVRYLSGDYPGAADLLGQALNLHRVIGDPRGQATAVRELGRVRRLTGDYPGAADLLGQALSLYQTIGNRRGHANTLLELGVVRRQTGDYPGANDLLGRALHLHRAIGNRHDEGNVLTQLAVVRYLTGDFPSAESLLRQALTILREIGTPHDEADTLSHLGALHRLTGHPERAHAAYDQALTIARTINHRLEEAHALRGIGLATLDLGDTAAALTHLRQARDIYHQLGVPEADRHLDVAGSP